MYFREYLRTFESTKVQLQRTFVLWKYLGTFLLSKIDTKVQYHTSGNTALYAYTYTYERTVDYSTRTVRVHVYNYGSTLMKINNLALSFHRIHFEFHPRQHAPMKCAQNSYIKREVRQNMRTLERMSSLALTPGTYRRRLRCTCFRETETGAAEEEKKKKRSVHFIGIGGAGLSALAAAALSQASKWISHVRAQ